MSTPATPAILTAPPSRLPAGHYRVWAQAISFATANAQVDLSANKAQNFTLSALEDYFRQLPGDVIINSLPEATDHDKRMKQLVRNDCTGCHTPSYTLQHKFDEAGWTAIIDLMKMVNVSGVYQGENAKPRPDISLHTNPALAGRRRGERSHQLTGGQDMAIHGGGKGAAVRARGYA